MKQNKVIKTIMYDDKYRGLKKSESVNTEIIMFQLNADIINKLTDYEGLKGTGIYFLINEQENNTFLYIGQAINIFNRIKQHYNDEMKEFNKVFAFTTKNNNLSKTYFDYLEYHYINKVREQNYFVSENKDKRTNKPNTTEIEIIEIDEYIKSIDAFLSFAEINLSIKSEKISNFNHENNIFKLDEAFLKFENGNYYLLKGSKIPTEIRNWNCKDKDRWERNEKRKEMLISQFVEKNNDFLELKDNHYILKNDLKVNSPSMGACLARGVVSSNGWTQWKNKDGVSLDEIYRKEN